MNPTATPLCSLLWETLTMPEYELHTLSRICFQCTKTRSDVALMVFGSVTPHRQASSQMRHTLVSHKQRQTSELYSYLMHWFQEKSRWVCQQDDGDKSPPPLQPPCKQSLITKLPGRGRHLDTHGGTDVDIVCFTQTMFSTVKNSGNNSAPKHKLLTAMDHTVTIAVLSKNIFRNKSWSLWNHSQPVSHDLS